MTLRREFQDWTGYTEDISPYGEYRSYTSYGGAGDHSVEHPFDWALEHQVSSPIARWGALNWRGSATATFKPPYATWDFPNNQATAGLRDKLTQSDFNAGVFGGEFRETLGFITSSVRKLALSIAAFRRGDYKRSLALLGGHSGSLSKTAADNWLAFQFGLVPLLSDIRGAYNLMTKSYQTVKRVRHKAFGSPRYLSTRQQSVQWKWDGYILTELRGVVDCEVTLADRLGLTDPASIAWELTRLSFVVDWLLPIGTFLEAVNARNQTRFVPGSLWITQAYKQTFSNPVSTDTLAVIIPFTVTATDFATKAVGQRWGLGSLPVRLPSLQNPLGLHMGQYVSSVALLRQSVGR